MLLIAGHEKLLMFGVKIIMILELSIYNVIGSVMAIFNLAIFVCMCIIILSMLGGFNIGNFACQSPE